MKGVLEWGGRATAPQGWCPMKSLKGKLSCPICRETLGGRWTDKGTTNRWDVMGCLMRTSQSISSLGPRPKSYYELTILLRSMDVWEGVAMDSLKFHTGPPCLNLLHPVGGTPLKRPYGCFWGVWGRLLPRWTPHSVRLRWEHPPDSVTHPKIQPKTGFAILNLQEGNVTKQDILDCLKVSLSFHVIKMLWKPHVMEISCHGNVTSWKCHVMEMSRHGNVMSWKCHVMEMSQIKIFLIVSR
jgi:hypothetical protein